MADLIRGSVIVGDRQADVVAAVIHEGEGWALCGAGTQTGEVPAPGDDLVGVAGG